MDILYNETYKVADYVGVRAQPISDDHLKLYQKRKELQVVIKAL